MNRHRATLCLRTVATFQERSCVHRPAHTKSNIGSRLARGTEEAGAPHLKALGSVVFWPALLSGFQAGGAATGAALQVCRCSHESVGQGSRYLQASKTTLAGVAGGGAATVNSCVDPAHLSARQAICMPRNFKRHCFSLCVQPTY